MRFDQRWQNQLPLAIGQLCCGGMLNASGPHHGGDLAIAADHINRVTLDVPQVGIDVIGHAV